MQIKILFSAVKAQVITTRGGGARVFTNEDQTDSVMKETLKNFLKIYAI